MTYWADDRALDMEQRRFDAEQARALKKMKGQVMTTTPATDEHPPVGEALEDWKAAYQACEEEDGDRRGVLQWMRDAEKALFAALQAALAPSDAKPVGYVCDGCGRLARDPIQDLQEIRKRGALSCCPERKMLPVYTYPDSSSDAVREALQQAEIAVTELCHDQDEANECWNILRRVQAALKSINGDVKK